MNTIEDRVAGASACFLAMLLAGCANPFSDHYLGQKLPPATEAVVRGSSVPQPPQECMIGSAHFVDEPLNTELAAQCAKKVGANVAVLDCKMLGQTTSVMPVPQYHAPEQYTSTGNFTGSAYTPGGAAHYPTQFQGQTYSTYTAPAYTTYTFVPVTRTYVQYDIWFYRDPSQPGLGSPATK